MNAIEAGTTIQVISIRARKAEVLSVRTDEHGDKWYRANLGGGWVKDIHECDAVAYIPNHVMDELV